MQYRTYDSNLYVLRYSQMTNVTKSTKMPIVILCVRKCKVSTFLYIYFFHFSFVLTLIWSDFESNCDKRMSFVCNRSDIKLSHYWVQFWYWKVVSYVFRVFSSFFIISCVFHFQLKCIELFAIWMCWLHLIISNATTFYFLFIILNHADTSGVLRQIVWL